MYFFSAATDVSILSAPKTERLTVFYNGSTGFICGTGWGIEEADVTCRQLGYKNALRTFESDDSYLVNEKFVISNIDCRGDEASLEECEIVPTNIGNTCQGGVASVTCVNFNRDSNPGMITFTSLTNEICIWIHLETPGIGAK